MDRGVGKVEDFGAKVEHPDRKGESFTKKVELRLILEHGVLKVERFLRKVEYPGRKVERSMRKSRIFKRKANSSS
ncbi:MULTISPECIES: hypothetical protein [Solibacillus]|uniref:hypothetical protein n=1 Tax=Solibacillus TaxID=648800 RepID=UPI0020415B33|nr:hypothetical protein [Solibacillus isronensis]MCM3720953.1 hypothetical protein [Solibacillus isronensis]